MFKKLLKKEENKEDKKTSTNIIKRIKLFDSIAKYSIYTLIALLPVLFLPTSLIDLDQVKIGLLVLVVLVAVISLGLSAIYSGNINVISKRVLIPATLISAVTFISVLFSTSYKDGFLGLGTEIDSWFLISVFLIVTVMISSVVNTKDKIFTASSLFWVSFGLVSVFQLSRLLAVLFKMGLLSNILSLGGRFDLPELNTIGTWADFGIVAGVSALSLAIVLDMMPLKKVTKNIAWFIFAISALMSFLASSILIGSGIDQLTAGSQFIIPSMTIVGLLALFFAIFQLIQRFKKESHDEQKDDSPKQVSTVKFPVASFILILLGLVTLISPLAVNQKINHSLDIPNESVLNIRPGISDTYQVSKSVIGSSLKNALIGIGPHGFYIAWNRYRPSYINNLDLWNTDYQYGSGYLVTSIVTNGILGFLLWLVSLIALFGAGFLSIFKNNQKDSSSVYTTLAILLPTLFLWFNTLINISGSMVVILTFIFTGLLIASLVSDKKIKVEKYSLEGMLKKRIFIIAYLMFVLMMLAVSFIWVERTRAQVYSTEAVHLIQNKNFNVSNVPEVMSLLKKSYDIYNYDSYARTINKLALAQIEYNISSDTSDKKIKVLKSGQPPLLSSSTEVYLQVEISSAKASIDNNPNDFRNLLQFGSATQAAALVTGDQAYVKLAFQSFLQAESLAKNHPLPLYSLANLYQLAGDNDSAKKVLERLLILKPDFTEASFMYQKILEDNASSSNTSILSTMPSVKSKIKNK